MGKFTAIDDLERFFVMEESVLDKIMVERVGVAELTFDIWKGNLSVEYGGNYQNDFKEDKLTLRLNRIAIFLIDRIPSHGDASALLPDSPLDGNTQAEIGPKTVVGVELITDSEWLDRLGNQRAEFRHLRVGTVDSTIDVVFGDSELLFR